MGIVGLWPLLKKKGYEPAFRSHVPLDRSTSEAAAVCRLDIQGTFYMNIRSAYIRHPAEIAHQIMEQQISKMVPKDRTVLYLDGAPAKEKESTHAQRRQTRQNTADDAEKLLVLLRDRIQKGESVRKWMFNAIQKATEKVFYWSAESRAEFAQYLEQNGWTVQVAPTEADLAIARDCVPADIVVSKDSDMAIYKNIPSLGSPTNFKLVKEIVDTDPARMVEDYLALDQVVLKNTTNESFANARRVFIDQVQEPVPPSQPSVDVAYEDLTHRLQDMREFYKQEQTRKEEQRRLSGRPSTTESNQKLEGFNRYRTVDKPSPNSGSRSWRPRYSHKTRVRVLQHDEPQGMVRYRWKPHRPRSTNSVNGQDNSEEDPSGDNSTGGNPAARPLESMGKLDLARAMRREHPISTLEIGTVRANARAALQHPPPDMSTLQVPWADVASAVDQCLKDVTKLASGTKRSCQLLVGRFVEQLSTQDVISSLDRDLLDLVCPRISARTSQDGTGIRTESSDLIDDDTEAQTCYAQFFTSLATYVYSGSCPISSKTGRQVEKFINRAHELGLCEKVDRGAIRRAMPYPGSIFLRSVGTQMASEYKRHFKQGTLTMFDKAMKLKERRPETSVREIDNNRSAVENFL
ncbi:hypothetical protein BGZ70_000443, partial [Mortierella alpina]